MSFVAAKCPECGGNLQLDNELEYSFCMHCGSKIVVGDAIKAAPVKNTNTIDTWMNMGNLAFEAGIYQEAYDYFSKAVEKEPDNWKAAILKGKAVGWQSTFENPRIDEFFQGINDAAKICNKLNLSATELNEIKILFAESTYSFFETFLHTVKDIRDKKVGNLHASNSSDQAFILNVWNLYLRGVGGMDDAMVHLEGMDGEKAMKIKLEIKKSIVKYLIQVCDFIPIFSEQGEDGIGYAGIHEQRAEMVSQYDKLMDEIKRVEPEFNKGSYIDRFEPPSDKQEAAERPIKLKKIEEKIDQDRKIKEAEYQKKKYWEEHPEEYKAHLAEEKRKIEEHKAHLLEAEKRKMEEQSVCLLEEENRKKKEFEERKNRLEEEIKNRSGKLEEMKRNNDQEIGKLRNEREKLGIFAVKQKKEIDEKIKTLEDELLEFRKRTSSLQK